MKRTLVFVLVLGVGCLSALGNAVASSHDTTDGLMAGFATRTITPVGPSPDGWDFWVNPTTQMWSEPFEDLNDNGCWDRDEPFTDDPRNSVVDPQSTGKWDGIWTNAGFGGQCAQGVLDDTWARAVVLSSGGTTVAMVSLDVVGFFNEEIDRAQAELEATGRVPGLDGLVVASTHTHEGPDTMGLWGDFPNDGKFPLYQAYIRSQIVDAVIDAYEAMEPASVRFGQGEQTFGLRDSRPPEVIDADVWAAEFVAVDDGETIGTLVNWSNHPEVLWSGNPFISSDYPHAIREKMERELGGVAIFFVGSVGGLMTPGSSPEEQRYDRLIEIGERVAGTAIDALDGQPLLDDPSLAVAHRSFFLPLDNQSLRALNAAGMFDKQGYTAGVPTATVGQDVKTEMYAVTLGPAVFVTVPGELFPEIALGVYGREDCTEADTGRPYEPGIRAQFDEADYHFVLGLGMDELGYIVPGYDFWYVGVDQPTGRGGDPFENPERWAGREFASPSAATGIGVVQAEDPCGERHYEETVSASSVMAPVVACVAAELAGKDPWNDPDNYAACAPGNTTTGPMGVNPTYLLD